MTKSISRVGLFCLLISCTQNAKPETSDSGARSIDTLDNIHATVDTARLNLDGPTVSPANFRILSENAHVRVLEYSLKPGQKDHVHTHPPKSGYVVSGGTLKIYPEHGEAFISEEKTGDTFWSDYVGKHYDENVGSTTVTIILTEIKSLE